MSFYGKVYTYQSHENFDAWLTSVGVPNEKAALILAEKSSTKIVKDGDGYIITQTTPQGDKVTTFKSGVEFDDTIGDGKVPIKTTFTVDGNTITQVFTGPLGTSTFRREYNGDDLVVYVTGDNCNVAAKRFYKA